MLAEHLGLRSRPFRALPDSDSYYPATTHENALADLRDGLADQEGTLLLSAEPGTGKTLLAHRLIDQCSAEVQPIFLGISGFRHFADLLRAMLYDLGAEYQGKNEVELRLAVTEALLQQFQKGGRTLLIVDEAHHLAVEVLEELRLLSNLEGRGGRAIQVLLVAQPSIEITLQDAKLQSLRQRIAVHTTLERLDATESADYLLHHVRLAGGRPDRLFTEEGLEVLTEAARGIPRLLNRVGSLALRVAVEAGVTCVDAEVALEAVQRLPRTTHAASEGVPTASNAGGASDAMPESDSVSATMSVPASVAEADGETESVSRINSDAAAVSGAGAGRTAAATRTPAKTPTADSTQRMPGTSIPSESKPVLHTLALAVPPTATRREKKSRRSA